MGISDPQYAQNPSGLGSRGSQRFAEGRHIIVQVKDVHNQPIAASDIDFFLVDPQRTLLGSISDSGGRATLRVSDESVIIGVHVTVDAYIQSVDLPPGQNTHTFIFPHVALFKSIGAPRARCPDGSSGQPCVDCKIGGVTVRICVV